MTLLPVDVQMRANAELGAALRRVDAALPDGWEFAELGRRPDFVRPNPDRRWNAAVRPPYGSAEGWTRYSGPTPTDALNALADALESRTE